MQCSPQKALCWKLSLPVMRDDKITKMLLIQGLIFWFIAGCVDTSAQETKAGWSGGGSQPERHSRFKGSLDYMGSCFKQYKTTQELESHSTEMAFSCNLRALGWLLFPSCFLRRWPKLWMTWDTMSPRVWDRRLISGPLIGGAHLRCQIFPIA